MSESGNSSPILIDARSLACPGPIIRLKALLDRIKADPSFSWQISGSGAIQEGNSVPDSPNPPASSNPQASPNPPASFSSGTPSSFPAPETGSGSVRIEVLAGNESAVANLQRFARHSGCTDIEVRVEECSASARNPDESSPRFWRVGMSYPFTRSGDEPLPSGISPESSKPAAPEAGSLTSASGLPGSPESSGSPVSPVSSHAETIFIASRFLGTGSEELGGLLMRGFIYTLTQLEPLPERLILMNSGVELACSGSDSLASLDALASRGMEIFVCGTCLEYYGLRPSLKVGKVSNMYEIAGFLAQTPVLRV